MADLMNVIGGMGCGMRFIGLLTLIGVLGIAPRYSPANDTARGGSGVLGIVAVPFARMLRQVITA